MSKGEAIEKAVACEMKEISPWQGGEEGLRLYHGNRDQGDNEEELGEQGIRDGSTGLLHDTMHNNTKRDCDVE